MTHPLIEQYVDNLRMVAARTSSESELFEQLTPFAKQLGQDKSWVEERFMNPDPETGFSAFELHQEPDHSLAVLAVSWVPGMGVDPHDHGTWALIVGVEGFERNIRIERRDNREKEGFAEIREKSVVLAGPGDVVCVKSGGIHAVRNDGSAVALSLHTYGAHINHTTRYMFNAEERTASRFQVAMN